MTATVPLNEQQRIDIGAIEKELAALWKQPKSSQGLQMTRACVMTLIVPVVGVDAADAATAVVSQLTDRFPNRAIVVDTVEQADDSIEAWVQAHCQLPGTGPSQICCEQISVAARGNTTNRVASVVLPLLVADVPAVVWWGRGGVSGVPLFERLATLADRVVVDSASFAEPAAELPTLLDLFGRRSVSDLAWGRLTPWRELTAQFFDSPSTVDDLNRIERVVVRYRSRAGSPTERMQPLLFIGWLAAKLGWQVEAQPEAAGPIQMRRADGQLIAIELEAVTSEDPTDTPIASVEISCTDSIYTIDEDPAAVCARTCARTHGMPEIQRVVRLEHRNPAALLAEDLRVFGRDLGYESALKIAAQIF